MIMGMPNKEMSVFEHSYTIGAPMTKIIICDDDCLFANKLSRAIRTSLAQYDATAQIHMFQYLEEMPTKLMSNCDIAFLDVDFADREYTGIDVARQLRELNKTAVIVFVTNYPEYAPEGYEVQAFRYLLKSELNNKLPLYLLQAIQQVTEAKRIFQIPVGGDILRLPLDNILYMEAQLHTVIAHVMKNRSQELTQYSFHSTLTSLENQLSDFGFLRIHKSYLVNMKHIVRYMCKEAILSNGIVLKVSEKNYAVQKNKYLLWKGRQ